MQRQVCWIFHPRTFPREASAEIKNGGGAERGLLRYASFACKCYVYFIIWCGMFSYYDYMYLE